MPSSKAPFRVDMTRQGLRFDRADLGAALAALPKGTPVVVMIHGYRFAPDVTGNCPHQHIFSLQPPQGDFTALSWPRHLGTVGLMIGFGWPARGGLIGASFRARAAGRGLAELARFIRAADPGRPLHVIAHSLGARVALAALHHATAGDFGRLILLAAAETRGPARRAMASAAGRAAQVFNITTRENDLFDFLYEWLAGAGLDTAIGQGLRQNMANWLDVQIDQPATLAALAWLGHRLPPAPARICHWSPYLRPGAFGLYRAILDGSVLLPMLRAGLPMRADPRWSRLWPWRWRVARAI
jgi:hypothetical protein